MEINRQERQEPSTRLPSDYTVFSLFFAGFRHVNDAPSRGLNGNYLGRIR